MEAFSVEQSLLEGDREVKELFNFVRDKTQEFEAYEIEKAIFAKLMKIGYTAIKCYFAEKGTGDIGPELELADGSVLKKASALNGRDYFSVFGKLKIPRSSYRIEGQNAVMPLDAQANLPQRCYSYLLQEWMDLFSIRDSFGEAVISLESLLDLDVKQSRFEVVSRESVKDYDQFYENKQVPDSASEGSIQVIGFDGKGVPVIKAEAAKIQPRLGKGEKRQKKKEAIVGVSYSIDEKVRTAQEVAENLIYPEQAKAKRDKARKNGVKQPQIRAKNIRRIASLERGKRDVMKEIVTDAKRRDPAHKRPLVAVMDGALGLWKPLALILRAVNWIGILDIIHVTEYLWKVGNALYGEKTAESTQWVYKHLLSILQGRVGRVIGGLKQILNKRKLKASQRKVLDETIRYFENHKKWMRYDEYLKEGYPIGSGVVESTCGHTVKSRMEGTGRRWSIEGAESILLLRSIYTSNDWIEYCSMHRMQERSRLYGNILEVLCVADDYEEKKAA